MNVMYLNPFTLAWTMLTRLPAPRHHHGVACVNGIVYVIGGVDEEKAKSHGGNGASKEVFAYDSVGLFVRQFEIPAFCLRLTIWLIICVRFDRSVCLSVSSKFLLSVFAYDSVSRICRFWSTCLSVCSS